MRKGSTVLRVTAGVLLFAAFVRAAEAPKYRVIVNSSNSVRALSRDAVARFFLKKVTSWPDGRAVLPVDQADSSPVRAVFSKGILHKSIAATKAYWQHKIFSGSDVPPPELSTDAQVMEYVKFHAGAIGYVSLVRAEMDVAVVRISE